MSYISLSEKDKKEMLERAGAASMEDLFGSLPGEIRLHRRLDLPEGLSEPELLARLEEIAGKSTYGRCLSFLGAGAYRHVIPTAVEALSSRGEFLSPYTPYQPEVSQGTLQVIFEFQTLICQLTGMDIANASLYDGASAAAEATLMANRLNGRTRLLLPRSLHPHYRRTIETYTRNTNLELVEVAYGAGGGLDLRDLESKLDDRTAAVLCQIPNYFGVVEDFKAAADLAHGRRALAVAVVAEAVSLGILEAPGRLGADIVTGEGQSFGLPLGFGGPYLGFMGCGRDFLRQLPGRISGLTVDLEGRRGFVLTLSTREQHIRREKATSNICTNQAWCALRATIFLETMGHDGLRELAGRNIHKARYALETLAEVPGVEPRFSGRVFNEFVLQLPENWAAVDTGLRGKDILAGVELERDFPELKDCVLVSVTEMHTKEDIDRLASSLREALR
ncbi:MAG: glycine dehydrogenase (aminomethyl-transferring) [Candidatus Aminicenantes bacterium RBG_13_63_10]|nr:MAG: glycine dehydrogenase (aminomethyl-transferring) [Candidatus Aminicenantes bacterium RBG_13_63_10]